MRWVFPLTLDAAHVARAEGGGAPGKRVWQRVCCCCYHPPPASAVLSECTPGSQFSHLASSRALWW